ncbi:MAG: 4-hydroxy-tetrahydrodipicolinate synthase [Lachnospiraceae bacterium]|nr:4-hydroxy-tetrahydrodipicolinate synthase [Lachnospiraceae bacterium]
MDMFTGAGVAIATPFKADGAVDYDAFDRLIEFQIEKGTDAIIVCGTTGESATLSEEEHIEVVKHCIKRVDHRIPVVAGAGSNATYTAVELSKEAEAFGADALLSVTPYYNKGTQDGMVRHFTAVSEAVNIPVIVYNVPSRTGSNISPQSMARLVKETKNVRGIKDATGDLAQCAMTMHLCGEDLTVYAGNDDVIVPVMALGGKGVISVLSNIAPKETHEICAKCLEGDYKTAGKLQQKAMPLIKALFCEVNPIPVKYGLELLGFESMSMRLPLTPMSDANRPLLEKEMKEYGLL